MKKLLLSTAILALTAGAALAADLPSRKAEPYLPPPPPPPPLWTGFYAGLNAGYGFGTNSQTNSAFVQYGSLDHNLFGSLTTNPMYGGALGANTFAMTQSGFIGGGQVGYNYQWGSNFVIGIEADMQGTGIRGNSRSVGIAGMTGPYQNLFVNGDYNQSGPAAQSINAGVDWMGTVRGRLGYLWTPTMLFYATGGLTYGGVYANVAATSIQSGTATNNFGWQYNSSQTFIGGGQRSSTLVGWNVGGGLEWMFMPNWSLKAEGIYWNMGNMNVGTAAFAAGNSFSSTAGGFIGAQALNYTLNPSQIIGGSRVNYQGVIARMGINYHFNFGGSAPIVAKY